MRPIAHLAVPLPVNPGRGACFPGRGTWRQVPWIGEWLFTDGHAKDKFSAFYDNLNDLPHVIDWGMVFEQYWHNTEDDDDRQRRKQAEFLIKSHVPVSCIRSIVVRTASRKIEIEALLVKYNLTIPVIIDFQNRLYYP